MYKVFRRLLFSTCVALSAVCAYDYHVPHLDFDAYLGTYRASGGATLFFPFGQLGCNTFFTQGSIGRFESTWTGNVGVGYRLQTAPNFGWGVNGFFDYAYSDFSNKNWFGGGAGFELFGSCWEARINGYIPPNRIRLFKRELRVFNEQVVIDNRPGVQTFRDETDFFEGARWGIDAEVGAGMCMGPGSLWAYGGYYRFQGDSVAILQGPRARLEYKLPLKMQWGMPEIWMGVEWRRDEVRHSQTAAVIHVQLPLFCAKRYGRCPNLCTFKRMGDSVRRQNGFIIETIRKERDLVQFTGLWFIREGAMGVGTQLDPTSLANASANSLPGDFVFALGPQNIDINAELAATYALQARQTLVSFGNGTTVTLNINGSPFVVTDITGSGRGPMIQTNAANPAITLNSDNLVQGIRVIGGNRGIVGNAQANATVNDVELVEQAGATFADSPIQFTNMTGTVNVTGNNVTMTTPAAAGISIANGAGQTATYTVSNNSVTASSATPTQGIAIDALDNTTVRHTLSGNTVNGFNSGGILVVQGGAGGRGTYVIEGNQISNTGTMRPGIALGTINTATNSQMSFRISRNTTTMTPGGGINTEFASAGGMPVIVNGAINQQNGLNASGSAAFPAMTVVTNLAAATDTATLLVDGNRFAGTPNVSFGSAVQNLGTLNLTITNNLDSQPGGAGTVVVGHSIAGGGVFCLTMNGNDTTRTKATTPADRNIQIARTAGTFNVTDLAGLPANNNGMTTNVSGTVNSVTTNCPVPTVP